MAAVQVPPIRTPYGQVRIVSDRYQKGGRLALCLVDFATGEPVATLTVNLVDASIRLASDEVFVKTWSENEPLVAPLLASGLFEDTGLREPVGYVHASVWRLRGALSAALLRAA